MFYEHLTWFIALWIGVLVMRRVWRAAHPSPLPSRHPNAKRHALSSHALPTIVPCVDARIPCPSGATCANQACCRGVNARVRAASAKLSAPRVTPAHALTATTSATPTRLFMPWWGRTNVARMAFNSCVVRPAANAFPVGGARPCIVSAPQSLRSSWPSTGV